MCLTAKPVSPNHIDIIAVSYNSVTLTWRLDTDGTTSYRVEKRPAHSATWEAVASTAENSYTVRGLQAGTEYYFRVLAENTVGRSKPRDLSQSIIPRKAFGESLAQHRTAQSLW